MKFQYDKNTVHTLSKYHTLREKFFIIMNTILTEFQCNAIRCHPDKEQLNLTNFLSVV